MRVENRKRFRWMRIGDIVVFLTIVAIIVLTFFLFRNPSEGSPTAVITLNGIEIYKINLEEVKERKEFRIETDKYHELIVIEDGKIRFLEADCPDKVCVNTGWIKKSGQIAVCLPAGVIVKIIGKTNDYSNEDVDIKLK